MLMYFSYVFHAMLFIDLVISLFASILSLFQHLTMIQLLFGQVVHFFCFCNSFTAIISRIKNMGNNVGVTHFFVYKLIHIAAYANCELVFKIDLYPTIVVIFLFAELVFAIIVFIVEGAVLADELESSARNSDVESSTSMSELIPFVANANQYGRL